MLNVYPKRSERIHTVTRTEEGLLLKSERYELRLQPQNGWIVRVTAAAEKCSNEKGPGITFSDLSDEWSYEVTDTEVILYMAEMTVRVNREKGAAAYYDSEGRLLLQENPSKGREAEKFMSYRMADKAAVRKEYVDTADGKKTVIKDAEMVEDEVLYHTRLHLKWQEDDRVYGLGQHEEGFSDLRGQTVYVHQANRKIAIPFLVTGKGLGLLMDTYSPLIFNDNVYGSYIYTEADRQQDYYVAAGKNPDMAIRGYRILTGKAAMLPKWVFGYIQSQERYETQEEILETAAGYRKRGLGIDGIVLDWQSWEGNLWGQKTFDKGRFPSAADMTAKLHDENINFMISIWPNMSETCSDYREFESKDLLLKGSNIYDAVSEEGRRLYIQQLEREMYRDGIDAWWCDSSEPFTPEWQHAVKPEPAVMYSEYCREAGKSMPERLTNSFSLFHARGVYEGQREVMNRMNSDKRVVNLTRSGYTGQQKYGTILWSGDISASWDTLRKQIMTGLNLCASGMPYWTIDIGAFFVKTGEQWFWDGEYPDAIRDPGYRELYTRWFQWGALLPVFRGHGTDCRREMWQFGDEGDMFYDALVKANRLRYELLPYIYSTAGKVWLNDSSMMRMPGLAFPDDEAACRVKDQYMFGEKLMVCPVTDPMYYDHYSDISGKTAKVRRVYLPTGCGWYDYRSGEYYDGGQWIYVQADITSIPLFVKEGSIIPVSDSKESTAGITSIKLRIFAGRDCECLFYEDRGNGYAYENGEYTLRRIVWDEQNEIIRVKTEYSNASADEYTADIVDTEIIQKSV